MIRRHGRAPGQSLIEILIGSGLGVIFLLAAAGLVAPSLRTGKTSGDVQLKTTIATQLMTNVRVWADSNWNNVLALSTSSASKYYFTATSSPFVATSGVQSIVIATGTYTRYFTLSDVYRDGVGNITSTIAGNKYDPSTKAITITYTGPVTRTSTITFYVTRNLPGYTAHTRWTAASSTASSSIVFNDVGSFTIQTSSVQISGTLQSPVVDTGMTAGAQLNSFFWQGNLPLQTTVKFQFAVSASSTGPWTYLGPDGSGATYYTPTGAGVPMSLNYTALPARQYFRYAATLISNSTGALVPTVTSVKINWSR